MEKKGLSGNADKICHDLALMRTGGILLRRASCLVDGWNQRVRNRVRNGPFGMTLAPMYVMNQALMQTRKNRQPIAAQSGYSIIEMMVVVIIIGIISGIAITSYRGQLPQSRLRLTTTELHSTFNLARVMAMSQNATITVKLSGGAAETVVGTDATVTSPITATIVRTIAGVDSQVTATTFHTDVASIKVSPGLVVGTARPWVRFNSRGFRAGTGNQLLVLTNTQGRVHSISVAQGGKSKWCMTSTC